MQYFYIVVYTIVGDDPHQIIEWGHQDRYIDNL